MLKKNNNYSPPQMPMFSCLWSKFSMKSPKKRFIKSVTILSNTILLYSRSFNTHAHVIINTRTSTQLVVLSVENFRFYIPPAVISYVSYFSLLFFLNQTKLKKKKKIFTVCGFEKENGKDEEEEKRSR